MKLSVKLENSLHFHISESIVDKCGESCDVRSGACKDLNDEGKIISKDACKAEHPCYPGCTKTCSDEPSADHCQGKSNSKLLTVFLLIEIAASFKFSTFKG